MTDADRVDRLAAIATEYRALEAAKERGARRADQHLAAMTNLLAGDESRYKAVVKALVPLLEKRQKALKEEAAEHQAALLGE